MHTKNPENFFSGLHISGSEFFFFIFIAIHLACYLQAFVKKQVFNIFSCSADGDSDA